jgi:hypothetical protein
MDVDCAQIPLREFHMTSDLLDRRTAVLSLTASAAGVVGVSASCTGARRQNEPGPQDNEHLVQGQAHRREVAAVSQFEADLSSGSSRTLDWNSSREVANAIKVFREDRHDHTCGRRDLRSK